MSGDRAYYSASKNRKDYTNSREQNFNIPEFPFESSIVRKQNISQYEPSITSNYMEHKQYSLLPPQKHIKNVQQHLRKLLIHSKKLYPNESQLKRQDQMIGQLSQQIERLHNILELKTHQIEKLNKFLSYKDREIKQLQKENQKFNFRREQTMYQQLKEIKKEIKNNNNVLQQYKQTLKITKQQNYQLKVKLQQTNYKYRVDFEKWKENKEIELTQFKTKINNLNQQIENLQYDLSCSNVEKQQLSQIINQQNKQIKKLESQIQKRPRMRVYDQFNPQNFIYTATTQFYNPSRNNDKSPTSDKYYDQMSEQSDGNVLKKFIMTVPNKTQTKTIKFSLSTILENSPEKKKDLLQLLKKGTKRLISSTSQLYRSNMQNKNNVHERIDNYTQILLLIQMQNGHILGGYCDGSFIKQQRYSNDFLFSLTNMKIYQSNRLKTLTYDAQHIIFGYSEIRIPTNRDTIFSNFGVPNRFFDNKGDNVNVLLGQGQNEREGKIKLYEIYKINFEQQIPQRGRSLRIFSK